MEVVKSDVFEGSLACLTLAGRLLDLTCRSGACKVYRMFNLYRTFNMGRWEEVMEKQLGVTEARQRLASIINGVRLRGDNYIIVKYGKPAAAVVPIAVYRKWQKDRQELFQVVKEIRGRNPQADPDQAVRQSKLGRDS